MTPMKWYVIRQYDHSHVINASSWQQALTQHCGVQSTKHANAIVTAEFDHELEAQCWAHLENNYDYSTLKGHPNP